MHVKVLRVFGVGGIDIVASSLSELPIVLDSLDAGVTGRGVGEHASDLVLLSVLTEVTLDWEVFVVSSKTGKAVEDWVGLASLLLDSLVWEENLEVHGAVQRLAPVLDSLQ